MNIKQAIEIKSNIIVWYIGLVIIIAFYMSLKMYSINPYTGDEHIYLYQAKLISQGSIPYNDFAMAHPPLQAIFAAVIIKLFGYNFILSRMLPVLWCLAGGLILAIMVYRELGTTASITSLALGLLAYEPLRASSHFTGINMTMTLLLAAIFFSRTRYMKTCSIFCVAAIITRLYAVPVVIALILWQAVKDRNRGFTLTVWTVFLGVGAFVLLGLWTGYGDMISNVVQYHFQKTPMNKSDIFNMWATVIFHNSTPLILFILSALSLLIAVVNEMYRSGKNKIICNLRNIVFNSKLELPLFSVWLTLSYVAILLLLDRIWMYYFVPIFPLAAIASGWMISGFVYSFRQIIANAGNLKKANLAKGKVTAQVIILLIFCLAFYFSPKLEGFLTYYEGQMKKTAEKRTYAYSWRPGLVPDFVNDLIKNTIWQDKRTIGKTYNAFTYLLWHESRIFNVCNILTEEIVKRTAENDKIFGDSGSIPLLALRSDRGIAGHEVDTNIQRYVSGNASTSELIERIDLETTRIIVFRRNFGIARLKAIQDLIQERYSLVKTARTDQSIEYYMFERK